MNPAAVKMNGFVPPARCFCDVDQKNCKKGVTIMIADTETRETNVWDRVRHTYVYNMLRETVYVCMYIHGCYTLTYHNSKLLLSCRIGHALLAHRVIILFQPPTYPVQ